MQLESAHRKQCKNSTGGFSSAVRNSCLCTKWSLTFTISVHLLSEQTHSIRWLDTNESWAGGLEEMLSAGQALKAIDTSSSLVGRASWILKRSQSSFGKPLSIKHFAAFALVKTKTESTTNKSFGFGLTPFQILQFAKKKKIPMRCSLIAQARRTVALFDSRYAYVKGCCDVPPKKFGFVRPNAASTFLQSRPRFPAFRPLRWLFATMAWCQCLVSIRVRIKKKPYFS